MSTYLYSVQVSLQSHNHILLQAPARPFHTQGKDVLSRGCPVDKQGSLPPGTWPAAPDCSCWPPGDICTYRKQRGHRRPYSLTYTYTELGHMTFQGTQFKMKPKLQWVQTCLHLVLRVCIYTYASYLTFFNEIYELIYHSVFLNWQSSLFVLYIVVYHHRACPNMHDHYSFMCYCNV